MNSNANIMQYIESLEEKEYSKNTIEKYKRDVEEFLSYLGNQEITIEKVIEFKVKLVKTHQPASVNSKIAALNSFFHFNKQAQFCVKPLKIQKQLFLKKEKELTQAEYVRLVDAAKKKGNERLSLLLQTICATGIRVSEVAFITVEAVKLGYAEVDCKGKRRMIFIIPKLQKLLVSYAKRRGIKSGSIFISRNNKPLNRHNIWSDMKKLCASAGVDKQKVFPHNLRHLFARTFYTIEKDIAKLADILGHSNINTTRIYTMETGREHLRMMTKMPLII